MTDSLSPAAALGPLVIEERPVERVWGSDRFGSLEPPIGEIWAIHEENLIASGPGAGSTLADAVERFGERLLGQRLTRNGETRFPLLFKLIEANSWLSIQVHPDDALAVELEGPEHRGKTEAWYVIDAAPGSEIIAGVVDSVDSDHLDQAIRGGDVQSMLNRYPAKAQETVYLPAGTVHALGPGVFIYEVQQSSDLTYRVYDWDRPATDGRTLHLEQSARAARVRHRGEPVSHPAPIAGVWQELVRSPYFSIERTCLDEAAVQMDPARETFHVLTGIDGPINLEGNDWGVERPVLGSVLVPADAGPYELRGSGIVLLSSIPAVTGFERQAS